MNKLGRNLKPFEASEIMLQLTEKPSVPIIGETTASLVITVEGKEVVKGWREQGW
jgi:hypothetical protein